MEVSITMSTDTINLGEVVTVTYSSTGTQDSQILADNMGGIPLDLGGDSSGTMKFLPLWSGTFGVTITGSGYTDSSGNFNSRQATAWCKVN